VTSGDRFTHRAGSRLAIDGASIYYEVIGRGDGPPLVMLHGGFGTMEDFNSILPGLDGPFSIIGIDSRGHGASTRGDVPLSYARLQTDVEALLDSLGLNRCHLMGFSDGGVVAYRIAAETSVTAESLVTIGSRSQRKDVDEARKILGGVTAEGWEEKFPDTVAAYRRLNPEPDFRALVPTVVGMWLDLTGTGYPDEAVGEIGCPTLVVRGDDDHLVSRRAAVDAVERIPQGHFLSIPFAGHAVHMERPDMFLLAANHFLEASTS